VFADTRYDGRTEWVELQPARRPIRLLRPAEPDRLLEDPSVLERHGRDDYMPYWAYLWPGAFLLAEALAEWDFAIPAETLELGCGLGLAGLVALTRGARVHFSDYDRAPLRFVEQSAQASGFEPGQFTTRLLDWRELPDERFDLILGADLLYEKRLIPLVAQAIDRLLSPDGIALLAGPYRVATEDFPEALERRHLKAESRGVQALDLNRQRVTGTLHQVRRAGSDAAREISLQSQLGS
jgi:predicted nicotinamide N-methyase